MNGGSLKKTGLLVVAALIASSPSWAGRFEVLGMGGAGGMYTPASSPKDPNLMFISCDMSGSYRSLDGGKTWEMIDSMELRSSRSCRPMFAGDAVYWVSGGTLKVSSDKGRTWQVVVKGQTPWGNAGATRLASLLRDPSVIFVGAGNAVYVSRDAGRTWQKGPSSEGSVGGLAAADGKVYAAVGPKLWVTADGGTNWSSLEIPQANGQPISRLTAGAQRQEEIVYALVRSVGVLRSTDGGGSWSVALSSRRLNPHELLMASNQTKVAYAADGKLVYRTSDGGNSWRSVFRMQGGNANVEKSWVQTEIHWGYRIMQFGLGVNAADPDIVLVSTQGDFYLSKNGGRSWNQMMNEKVGVGRGDPGFRYRCTGLEVTSVWDFLFDPWEKNRLYIAYTDIGFARSVDRGKTWIHAAKGSPWGNTFYKVVFDPYVKGKMYAAASNRHDIPHWTHINSNTGRHSGGVVITEDFAIRWRNSSRGLPQQPCTSICIDPKNSKPGELTMYVTMFEGGVYKSTDSARSWVKKSNGLGNPGNLHCLQVEVHPKSGDVFCSITAHRQGQRDFPIAGGLWKSTDGGENWRDLTKALDLRWPTYFTMHPTNPDILYLSAATAPNFRQGGVYKTTDGGETWKRIISDDDFAKKRPPSYTHCMNVKLHPDNPDFVYVCASHGLWVSTDAGETWKWFTGIPFGSAQNVAFDPLDRKIMYVTTFGGGIWKGPYLP